MHGTRVLSQFRFFFVSFLPRSLRRTLSRWIGLAWISLDWIGVDLVGLDWRGVASSLNDGNNNTSSGAIIFERWLVYLDA